MEVKFRRPSREEILGLFKRWFIPIDFHYHGYISWLKVTGWLFGLMLGGLWFLSRNPVWGAVSVAAQIGAMIADDVEEPK